MSRKLQLIIVNLFCLLALAACGNDKHSELKKYVKTVKQRPAPPVDPMPKITIAPGREYQGHGLRSPFQPFVSKRSIAEGPDQNREKELLESYPLDSLRMVGVLYEDDKTWAIILAPDGTIDKVTAGGYIGQNYGKVSKITSTGLILVETVPRAGDWEKREASLALAKEE